MRHIKSVLRFRSDISPFLVHLTRSNKELPAKETLQHIIELRTLFAGVSWLQPDGAMSDARFGISRKLTDDQRRRFFGFLSFTETPLSEIHCLLDIKRRTVNLEPYGLVFLKDRLAGRGVSPVFYVNNLGGDKDAVVRALASLIKTHPKEAAQILPLIAVFGKMLTSEGAAPQSKPVDFTWEREWRLPYIETELSFDEDDVFLGLCPEDEIKDFQKLFPRIEFIDPRLSLKLYAPQLIRARKRLKLKHSVV